jgi:arsenite-transporting ATPase
VAPRTILYTGKGGVGKTSVAAASARRCAAAGLRTVVISTDPAHSLSDSLEAELGGEPTRVGERLFAQEVQAQAEMERHWEAVSAWVGELLAARGVDPISAEELTVPPGMDELFALLQIKRHHVDDEFDVVIVDCAPTGETLRLLSFPDVCSWWLEKVFPFRGRLVAAARPLARSVLDVSLPSEAVFEDVERLASNLIDMNAILRDRSRTSVRLVVNPERMVVKEAMRTFTYLNLYGYLTDAVVVNRVLPERAADGYFAGWRAAQQEQLELVRSGFAPVPVLCAPHFRSEVIGPAALDELGDALFGGGVEVHARLHDELTRELTAENGRATLRVALPFAAREDIDLKKVGLEVIVKVDGQRRTIMLPSALAGYATSGARFSDGALEVTFERGRDGPEPGDAAD